jgi:heptosyltransferase-2
LKKLLNYLLGLIGMKILIIKLGALGDVIRTLPLAAAIKKKNPTSDLTWITKSNAVDIIKTDKNIDYVITITPKEKFDILYNFDIDDTATKMASEINAKQKKGFCFKDGFISAFNLGAEYYLNTLFDDELKKSNKKTYQEMMFEAAELQYEKEKFKINLTSEEIAFGKNFISQNNLSGKEIIGIHIGSSPRWPSKAWHENNIINLIKKIKPLKKEIIFFSGPDDQERMERIMQRLRLDRISVLSNNPSNTLREFASLVNICDLMICNDSLALHISMGFGKPTIGLFFCTSPNEVESYDLLTKIISPKLYDFFPEKMDQYNENLVKTISPSEVLEKINLIFNHRNK